MIFLAIMERIIMNIKKYQTVNPFNKPSNILNELGCAEGKSEMTVSELAFLCGLIRDYKPKKIVEVGVAAGGTTVVMLNCLHELRINCDIYSIDISEQYYRDLGENRNSVTRKTGFLVDEMEEYDKEIIRHSFLTGKLLPERLDEIGDGIDFLILDTTHFMPGEVLDFIAAFPYLTNDAIVVLHDVILQHKQDRRQQPPIPSFCTGILFQTVTADKFLNNQEIYPNIGAFKINEDTSKYIADLFMALMINWFYMLKNDELEKYEIIIKKYYPLECLQLFRQAVLAADTWFNWNDENKKIYETVKRMMTSITQNILLYGAGKRGTKFLSLARNWNIEIKGFIISDDQYKEESVCGISVYKYSQIPFIVEETLIIQTANSLEIEYKLRQSKFHWLALPDAFWRILD